jgi:hypothetical protein
MSWNKTTAVNHAKSHAGSHSQGRCAEFTRKAIQSGGISLGNTYHAKDYGSLLKTQDSVPSAHLNNPEQEMSSSFNLMRRKPKRTYGDI